MTTARSHLIDQTQPGCYHVISRCVRRSFLCSDQWAHRRDWIETAVREQATVFAVDIFAYAVMSNHFHLVMKVHPDRAARWSGREVAERWAVMFPLKDDDGNPKPPDLRWLDGKAADAEWVSEHRARLSSLSWFMKVMKERIARRANREDRCTGHFWEGRFTSVSLLDQAAVIACMAYVDLNLIRARQADRPESSELTSIQRRIEERQMAKAGARLVDSGAIPTPADPPLVQSWLAPLEACTPWSDKTSRLCPCPLSTDDYLELVDQTGRIVRIGKRGAIPTYLSPILARLELDLGRWRDAMSMGGRFGGSAIGCALARAKEAVRRGVKWIVDRSRVHPTDGEAAVG